MMGLKSTSLSSEQKKDAKRNPLERRIKKKEFNKFKEILGRAALVTTLILSGVGIYKCSDSPTDNNPTAQTDAGNKADAGESKDASSKDVETSDVQSEDASDGGSAKDVETPDEDKPDVGPADTGAEVETPDEDKPDVGPADAGAEVETPDGNAIDAGPVTDGEIPDVPQQSDGGNDTSVEDTGSDAATADVNGGDNSPDVPQQVDGGDQLEDVGADAGMTKELCDEYLGVIPAWANVKVPLAMFKKYFSGVTGFAEKIAALEAYVTDINGERVVLLGGTYDAALPSLVKITAADVLFGVEGVPKMDGTNANGLCKQNMLTEELNAAYQAMMADTTR